MRDFFVVLLVLMSQRKMQILNAISNTYSQFPLCVANLLRHFNNLLNDKYMQLQIQTVLLTIFSMPRYGIMMLSQRGEFS